LSWCVNHVSRGGEGGGKGGGRGKEEPVSKGCYSSVRKKGSHHNNVVLGKKEGEEKVSLTRGEKGGVLKPLPGKKKRRGEKGVDSIATLYLL